MIPAGRSFSTVCETAVTCASADVAKIQQLAEDFGAVTVIPIGVTAANKLEIRSGSQTLLSERVADLREPWGSALEDALTELTPDALNGVTA